MRRLPLYCEVGPTILLTTAGEEINFATREGVSSLFVFCVCVIRCAFYNSRVCLLCVECAASCTLFGALLLCVSGVFGCERE